MKRGDLFWWLGGVAFLAALILVAVLLNLNYTDSGSSDSSAINIDNGDLKINWDAYPSYYIELTESYEITAPGTYYLSGSIEDGGISVRLVDNGVARLVLENVSIKNSTGPAIACYSGDDLVIESVGTNYLEDGANYIGFDDDVKGAIYTKTDLTLTGDGSLNIKANYQDGIVGKDDVKISGGTYNIVASDDGIRGKDSVYIVDGKINIEAKGDGIKSNNETELSKGFILISGGEVNIAKSYEGLEARKVIIDDGRVSINANDDGINTAGNTDGTSTKTNNPFDFNENNIITINGGSVYVNAAGDGLDSNGYIYVNGGSLVVDGPTNSGNGALDAGAGIIMNGGTAVAVGASGMAENFGSSSAVYNVSIFFTSTLAKDTKVEIKNSSGETIISHTSAKTFSHMAVGSSDFRNGETYTIYINGDKYESFTISDIVTIVGNGGNMGPGSTPGGNMPTGGPGGNPLENMPAGRSDDTSQRR